MRLRDLHLESLACLPSVTVAEIREALFSVASELKTATETAKMPANPGVDRFGVIALTLGRVSSIARTTLRLEPLKMKDGVTGISLEAIGIGLNGILLSVAGGLKCLMDAEKNGVADEPGVKEQGARQLLSAWFIIERLLACEPLRHQRRRTRKRRNTDQNQPTRRKRPA